MKSIAGLYDNAGSQPEIDLLLGFHTSANETANGCTFKVFEHQEVAVLGLAELKDLAHVGVVDLCAGNGFIQEHSSEILVVRHMGKDSLDDDILSKA
jgi:hypothetical protein